MNLAPQDLSYFTLRLQELLNTSFPELSGDKVFITHRSRLASHAYKGAFLAGNPIELCNEIADYILFENLHFSQFDTIFRVICSKFDTILSDEELHPFALKMLGECKGVFEQYLLNEEFVDSPEFDLLYTELTGSIQIWIEEQGLE